MSTVAPMSWLRTAVASPALPMTLKASAAAIAAAMVERWPDVKVINLSGDLLAKRLGGATTKRTAQRHIEQLGNAGWLSIERSPLGRPKLALSLPSFVRPL